MKFPKFLRSTNSSENENLKAITPNKNVNNYTAVNVHSAPNSPTTKHSEEGKPPSFFSRSFRKSKSYTRLRNFFENISQNRNEEDNWDGEEVFGDVESLPTKQPSNSDVESSIARKFIYDERAFEVIKSVVIEQQRLIEQEEKVVQLKTSKMSFFEISQTSTAVCSSFESQYNELFAKAGNNKNGVLAEQFEDDGVLIKLNLTFEMKKRNSNVNVLMKVSKTPKCNENEHSQHLPLSSLLSILNALEKHMSPPVASLPKVCNSLQTSFKSNPSDSNLQWTDFINHTGNEKLQSIVASLKRKERNIFESIFEIISSEHTYIQGLKALVDFSKKDIEETKRMSSYDSSLLFGNIESIYVTQGKLFKQMILTFQSDIFMKELFSLLEKFYEDNRFQDYIKFITDQKKRNEVVKQKLHLNQLASLWITPMQRIVRYPLLLDAVLSKIKSYLDSEEYSESNLYQPREPNKPPEASLLQTKKTHKVLTRLRSVFKLQPSELDSQYASSHNTSPKHVFPRMQVLLKSVEECYNKSKKFADRCNEALSYQEDMEKLIELKKRFVNGNIPNLVVTNRRILYQFTASCFELQNYMEVHQKYNLILLTDLFIVAKVETKKSKEDYYYLVAYDQYDRVDCKEGFDCEGQQTEAANAKDEIKVNRMKKSMDVITIIVDSTEVQRDRYWRPFILERDDKKKFVAKLTQLKNQT